MTMKTLHLEDPLGLGLATVRGLRKDQPAVASGAGELVNFWVSPKSGEVVTRPAWRTTGLFGPAQAGVGPNGHTGVSWGPTLYSVSSGLALHGILVTGRTASYNLYHRGLPALPLAIRASPGTDTGVGQPMVLPWTRSIQLGQVNYILSRAGNGLIQVNGLTGTTNTADFNVSSNPSAPFSNLRGAIDFVWAFGRLWVLCLDANENAYIVWSNAGGSSLLTAAGAGGIALSSTAGIGGTGEGIARAIAAVGNKLVVVWDNALQFYGDASGANTLGTPTNPAGANGFLMSKVVPGIGTLAPGLVQTIGESLVILTKRGFIRVQQNLDSGALFTDEYIPQASDLVSRFFASLSATGNYDYTANLIRYSPMGAFMVWCPSLQSLGVFTGGDGTTLNLWIAFKDPKTPKVFAWQCVSPQAASEMQYTEAPGRPAYATLVGIRRTATNGQTQVMILGDPENYAASYIPSVSVEVASAYGTTVRHRLGAPGVRKHLKNLGANMRYRLRTVPSALNSRVVRLLYGDSSRDVGGCRLTPPVSPKVTTGTDLWPTTRPDMIYTTQAARVPLMGTAEEVRLGLYVADIATVEVGVDTFEVDFILGARNVTSAA